MKVLKLALLSLFIIFSTQKSTAQKFCQEMKRLESAHSQNTIDLRADTFDVVHYWINANFLNYRSDRKMTANTVLKIVKKLPSSTVTLDLLGLQVDYALVNHTDTVNFDHNGEKLNVQLPSSINVADTFLLEIGYQGIPKSDASWGGFYFSGEYAYNLGVGFSADPHNFGRVWFPCFDNFTDRATYIFNIETEKDVVAMCNGELISVLEFTNSQSFHWRMDEPIPTYLASVAIAPYEWIEYEVDSIPVILASVADDTSDMKSSFENLPSAIRAFVQGYGDHSFSRVGFNIVPFNGGAMEHATNIAYPRFAITAGSKNYETLFAHELAHHWWGNTVTCRTQEDMWINEGWASFSERLFTEYQYGKEAYDQSIGENHKNVVHYAHIRDGESLPVSGIGHANTYGMHVYNKGADMVHTLRGFMGDSAFFEACASFQSTFKFKDVSSDDMESHFQQFTQVDLAPFFAEWIKTKGFAHYAILSVEQDNSNYKVRIKQNQRFSEIKYTKAVSYLQVFSKDREKKSFKILIEGEDDEILIDKSEIPFTPEYWALDFDQQISDAVTDEYTTLVYTDEIDMPLALFEGKVNKITDTALLRVEHHWVSPDQYFNKIPGLAMSKERYWTVDGVWSEDLEIEGKFRYNGLAPSSNPASGFLDNKLIKITEDSLVLLYRPNAISDWQIHPNYTKEGGSAFDKRGSFTVSDLQKGQYTFGIYDQNLLSTKELKLDKLNYEVMPNPADTDITVILEKEMIGRIEITSSTGQVVKYLEMDGKQKVYRFSVGILNAGVYFVGVTDGYHAYERKAVVIK